MVNLVPRAFPLKKWVDKQGKGLDLGAEPSCITKFIIGQQTILPETVLVEETLRWHQDTALSLISVENEMSAVSLWLPVGRSLRHLVSYTNNPLFLSSLFQILICNELLVLFPFFF